ncbi:SCO family protein [Empedobacter brevis]|uniref:SCO family protein n=1 Tax=Empedobacter brevis TaxID=247 RepID=UPI0023F4D603|nr:SCO family protein [Empedobacter brevis]
MNKQLIAVIVIILGVIGSVFWLKNRPKDELYKVMKVPEFSMTNQHNQTITDRDMLGKVYVVEFFFTSCPTICPVMSHNLRSVEDEINDPNLGFISVTIDPKRDTPDRLLEYSKQIGVKTPNWHYLTANRKTIEQLSDKFNIYVGKDETTAEGLNHSGKLALVDKQGNIRSRYTTSGVPLLFYSGLNYKDPQGKEPSLSGAYHPEIEFLKEDIKKLLAE